MSPIFTHMQLLFFRYLSRSFSGNCRRVRAYLFDLVLVQVIPRLSKRREHKAAPYHEQYKRNTKVRGMLLQDPPNAIRRGGLCTKRPRSKYSHFTAVCAGGCTHGDQDITASPVHRRLAHTEHPRPERLRLSLEYYRSRKKDWASRFKYRPWCIRAPHPPHDDATQLPVCRRVSLGPASPG